jgi:hypothetical protein
MSRINVLVRSMESATLDNLAASSSEISSLSRTPKIALIPFFIVLPTVEGRAKRLLLA